MTSKIFERIAGELEEIPLVDTHEHLQPQIGTSRKDISLFSVLKEFVVDDLISAGMEAAEPDNMQAEPSAQWERIKPYLPHVQTTTYFRFHLAAFRALFDFRDEEIHDRNWLELSERIIEANKKDDWYKTVLKDKANLEIAFLDRKLSDEWNVNSQLLVPLGEEEIDRNLYLPVLRADSFLYRCSRSAIEKTNLTAQRKKGWGLRIDLLDRLIEEWGMPVKTLEDYLALIDTAFQRTVMVGGVAVKLICAYERSLRFEAVTRREAEEIFVRHPDDITVSDATQFEDFILRVIVERAIENDLPIQIHTGMQAGNGNILNNANPLHLNNLFLEYPEAKFDVFHGGIPFTEELGILSKTFPNVYINLCFMPQLSDTFTKHALSTLIDLVPGNKFLWGGDCYHVEVFYGTMLISKKVVAEVLAQKVSDGCFGMNAALDLSKKIFRDNALKLYRPEKKLTINNQ